MGIPLSGRLWFSLVSDIGFDRGLSYGRWYIGESLKPILRVGLSGDDGNILEVKDRTDLFDGRDSRLYATVLIPGAEWTNAKEM